ncbi:MAG: TIGR03936 family radical SAM-associated protein [Ruminococcus sp.]|nr:TIGR03936 family radical SAM-associated protein [Ruminococcus sp.]
MIRLRAEFEKKGRAKYISHLDLNRCMLRTFRRSRLPIWYTEGFNPHPYYAFALALSLGFESNCEILDFNLNEEIPFDEVRDRLNSVMPEGMRIIRVWEQKMKITAIKEAEYCFSLVSENVDGLFDDINKLLSQENIFIGKKTKKGMKTVDIKPDMKIISCENESGRINVRMRLPAGTQTNFNPNLFIEALKNSAQIGFSAEKITRTGIFCDDNMKFE